MVDRETPLLLPPSLQDWVPEDHPARLVVELVESLDLTSAKVNDRGTGSAQYPPSMMLSLLLYRYSAGVFSSREIEKATYDDVGVRYICAENHPDHDTICAFRRHNGELIRSAFSQSLRLAAQVGLIRVGKLEIAIDGTKLAANAGSRARRSVAQIESELMELDRQTQGLERTVEELLVEAEKTDRREEQNHRTLPESLTCAKTRAEKLRQAKELIAKKERRRARLEAARAALIQDKQERHDRRERQREEIKDSEVGHVPRSLSAEVEPSDEVNVSDPQSVRLRGEGKSVDGYNAQASVDMGGIGLIVGCHVCAQSSDRQQLRENLSEVEANLGAGSVAVAVADKGFENTYQIESVRRAGGPLVLCEQQGDPSLASSGKASKRDRRTNRARRAQRRLLERPENRLRRRRRKTTVEPTFGIIKEQMGYRRSRLRGREGADVEWGLVSFGFNLRKLFRDQQWREAMKRKSRP